MAAQPGARPTGSFDLLIFPSIYSFVPVFSRAEKIVFIHDVIAETFPHLTFPNPRSRLFWKAKTALGRLPGRRGGDGLRVFAPRA